MNKQLLSVVLVTALSAAAFAPAGAVTISLRPILSTDHAATVVGVNRACSTPDAPAAIAGAPFFEMPRIAEQQGVSGVSEVKIDLSQSGALTAESLAVSSGNRWLDAAAMRSARMSYFVPELKHCDHVSGSYLYEVAF